MHQVIKSESYASKFEKLIENHMVENLRNLLNQKQICKRRKVNDTN